MEANKNTNELVMSGTSSLTMPTTKLSDITALNPTTTTSTVAPPVDHTPLTRPTWWYTVPSVPIYTYPTQPPYYEYDDYGYLAFLVIFVVLLVVVKIIILRKKSVARQARQNNRARQTQVPTVSGSVDSNQAVRTSEPNSDDLAKSDLPPAYDEVMKNAIAASTHATQTTPSDSNALAHVDSGSSETIEIEIENIPPPPPYSSTQPS